MKLPKEAVMHVDGGVKVGMALVVTNGTKEELAPLARNALACLEREPHALAATPRTILRSAMGIDFDAYHARCIRFFFGKLVDFAFQLVGLFAIEPPGFASPLWFDHPQAFKEQHTARILLTDLNNRPCCFVCAIPILAAQMSPELLIAALSLDRLAGLPLLFGAPFEVPVAVLIQAMIGNKTGCSDDAMLAH